MKKLLTLLFIAFLVLPALGVFIQPDTMFIIKHEKRNPAAFPELPLKHGNLADIVEAWLGDRIFGRSWLLKYYSDLMVSLGASPQPEKIVIGKDGWFFLGNKHNNKIAHYRNTVKMNKRAYANNLSLFIHIHEVLQANHIPLIVCIAPDKNVVYPEKLPDWIVGSLEPETAMQMHRDLLNNGIDAIYLYKDFIQLKDNGYTDLYYPEDSHWNRTAGFYATEKIIQRAKEYLPELMSYDFDSIEFKPYSKKIKEFKKWLFDSSRAEVESIPWSDELFTNEFILRTSRIKKDQRISAFKNYLPGPKPEIIINKNAGNKLKMLFLRDSFGAMMATYMNQHFRRVIHWHYSGLKKRSFQSLIEQFSPDLVVFQIVERNILEEILN